MFFVAPIDNAFSMSQQALLNETYIQAGNAHYIQASRKVIARKSSIRTCMLRKTMAEQIQAAFYQNTYKKQLITAANVVTLVKPNPYIATQRHNYPIAMNSPFMTEILPQTYRYGLDKIEEEAVAVTQTDTVNADTANTNHEPINNNALEFYLNLPKQLFPSPKMLPLDPNPLIDEFCKMPVSQILSHAPWLLDLDLGIPKYPTTRLIPKYNVKFNSINCKNTPNAIHPGFEYCDPDFKKALLFYHDCVVSAWYNSYVTIYGDTSVENFESWLSLPMEALGMAWA